MRDDGDALLHLLPCVARELAASGPLEKDGEQERKEGTAPVRRKSESDRKRSGGKGRRRSEGAHWARLTLCHRQSWLSDGLMLPRFKSLLKTSDHTGRLPWRI